MVMEFKARRLARAEKQMEKTLFSIFRPQDDLQDASYNLVQDDLQDASYNLVCDRRVHAWIGCSVVTAAKVWCLVSSVVLYDHGPEATMYQLCWALYMLKHYPEEAVAAAKVGADDEQTFSHWVWIMIEQMSSEAHKVVSCRILFFSIVIDSI
jgi:hypothetical protein